jgi:hypothetical protein
VGRIGAKGAVVAVQEEVGKGQRRRPLLYRGVRHALFRPRPPRCHHNGSVRTLHGDNGKEIDAGVNKEEATDFFLMLQKERVRLDNSTLVVQRLSGSSHKIDGLVKQAQRFEAGWYLVAAECDQELQHCFAMLVPDGEKNASTIKIIDGFDANADPPCVQEALSHLEWLDHVIFIRRVKFLDNFPFAGKRKTKTERAREKRAKLGGSM